MNKLPARPNSVVVGAALLLGSALALAGTWALGIDAVESNGARVFFIVLWGFLAWAAYGGAGWVWLAIVAVFVVAAWSGLNQPSFTEAMRAMPAGGALAQSFALVALAVLWTPTARKWFASARELRSQADD